MASAPQAEGLPILYQNVVPLSSQEHASWKVRQLDDLSLIKNMHAIPLTLDEFAVAQRFFPIVFSVGPDPVPLALMGLNSGVNTFLDEDNQWPAGMYLPAYVRRYPFLLIRTRQDSDDLTLCFDPTPNLLGEFEDGTPLFENGQATQRVQETLAYCEQFELAAQRTNKFMQELAEYNIMEEGELTIRHEGSQQNYSYRGFGVINEEKLRELRGDQLRKMNQNGMLSLVYAHLFSLNLVTDLFNRQMAQGKVPVQSGMGT